MMKKWNDLSMRERAKQIRENVQRTFRDGGSLTDISIDDIRHQFDEGGDTKISNKGDILGLEVPLWTETVASFTPFLGTAMDIKQAWQEPTFENIATAGLSTIGDLAGLSVIKGLSKLGRLHKAEKAVKELAKTAGKTEDYSRLLKAQEELREAKKVFNGGYGPDAPDEILHTFGKYGLIGLDQYNNVRQNLEKHGININSYQKDNGGKLFGEGGPTEEGASSENYFSKMSDYINSYRDTARQYLEEKGITDWDGSLSAYNHMKKHYALQYAIPYDESQKLRVTTDGYNARFRGAKTSTGVLDAIADAAEESGLDLATALGIAGKESNLGQGYNMLGNGNDPDKIRLVSAWNSLGIDTPTASATARMKEIASKYTNQKQVTKEEFEFYKDYLDKALKSIKVSHAPTEDPLVRTFRKFKEGYNGNPGDPNNRQKAIDMGEVLINDPAIREHYLKTGRIKNERIPINLSGILTVEESLQNRPFLFDEGGPKDDEKKTLFEPIEHPVIPEVPSDQDTMDWLANWYNNRRKQLYNNRIQARNLLVYSNLPNSISDLMNNYEIGRTELNKEYYRKLNSLAHPVTIPVPKEEYYTPRFYGNLGVNDGDTIFINYHHITPNSEQESGTKVHERVHSLHDPLYFRGFNEQTHILNDILVPKETPSSEYDKYLNNGEEGYPRLMEFRRIHDIDPNKVWNVEEVKQLLEQDKEDGKEHQLYKWTPESVTKALNEVAYRNQDNAVIQAANGGTLFAEGGPEDKDKGGYDKSTQEERINVFNQYDPTAGFFQFWNAIGTNNNNEAKGEENEYWKAYLGLNNAVPKMNPNAKTEWDDQVEAEKVKNGEMPSDFYGTTPRMDYAIQAMADTMNLRKRVEETGSWQNAYEKAKDIMEHPGEWREINGEALTPFWNPDKKQLKENFPLGMLRNFGIKWDPETGKLYVHDTYDFDDWVHTFGNLATHPIPRRPKEMKIRGAVGFDPKKGAQYYRGLPVPPVQTTPSVNALGGPLYNAANPIESFSGLSKLPQVRY